MLGVNEDRYWMQVQARYERWDDEDEDGEVNDNSYSDIDGAWECADISYEERVLEKNRSI